MRNAAILLVLSAIAIQGALAQSRDVRRLIPVYIDSHNVKDETSSQFVFALNRALSNSPGHDLGAADVEDRRLRFYLEVLTVDINPAGKSGNSAVASVVIEQMGLPHSSPERVMWYHKVFLLNRATLDDFARRFVADMDSRWCSYNKSSVGTCPIESLPPELLCKGGALIDGCR
jgi:hypothetical protein